MIYKTYSAIIENIKGVKMEKHALTKRKIDKKLIFYIACFALPVLQFLIFYIGVNFQSILLAFQKYDGKRERKHIPMRSM